MIIFLLLIILILVSISLSFYQKEVEIRGGAEEKSLEYYSCLFKKISPIIKSSPKWIYYTDIDFSMEYQPMTGILKNNCHIGQRKLLLNEIQFFTHYSSEIELFIYVGAAPCEHLTFIQELFPGKKYLLIDPNYCIFDAKAKYIYQNPDIISDNARRIVKVYASGAKHQRNGIKRLRNMEFALGKVNVTENPDKKHMQWFENQKDISGMWENNDICIIQDYMTIDLARKLLKRNLGKFKYAFISDLRTNLFSDGPEDLDIIFNDCLQIALLDILKPLYSMLKFHPPYHDQKYEERVKNEARGNAMIMENIDYVSNLMGKDVLAEYEKNKHWNYAAEHIFLQPWGPKSSTEARLIVSAKSIISKEFANYCSKTWENTFFPLKFIRTYSFYDFFDIPAKSYDKCYDCFLEMVILAQYILGYPENDYEKLRAVDPKKIYEMYLKLNSHLKYDLHKNKSAKCRDHGFMVPHKTNWFYVLKDNKFWKFGEDGNYEQCGECDRLFENAKVMKIVT